MLDQAGLKALALELSAAMPPAPTTDSRDDMQLPVLRQTPRARAIRRIAAIANSRGWQIAITRALDRHGVSCVDDLENAAVFALRDDMERYEDCAQTCCDPDDGFPAR